MTNTFSRREILKLFGIAGAGAAVEGPAALAQLVKENPQLLSSISDLVQQTVTLIRDLCKAQVEDWKKIPDLALEVDGRTGYSEDYQRAYSIRLWRVHLSNRDYYWTFVDLKTGELVFYERTPASDAVVLSLGTQMQQIDAKAIVEYLQQRAREPHFYAYDVNKVEAWRAEKRKKYGLNKPRL